MAVNSANASGVEVGQSSVIKKREFALKFIKQLSA